MQRLAVQFRALGSRLLRTRGKEAFVARLPKNARLLDVGCGNDSPMRYKLQRPDIDYTGIDGSDYCQSVAPDVWADRSIIVTADAFAAEIGKFSGQCAAVLSSSNIEHCLEPYSVLLCLLRAFRPGGRF